MQYARNLATLDKLVLYRFADDETGGWHEEYEDNYGTGRMLVCGTAVYASMRHISV